MSGYFIHGEDYSVHISRGEISSITFYGTTFKSTVKHKMHVPFKLLEEALQEANEKVEREKV